MESSMVNSMDIQVAFRGLSSTAAIAGHVDERLEHALRHFKAQKTVRAVLSSRDDGFRVDLELNAGDRHFRSHANHDDLYDAINVAAAKLGRQIDHEHEKRSHPRTAEA